MRVLTNDPSFTAWGWAVVAVSGRVYATGVIVTKPSAKKKRIRKSDDRAERTADIVRELLGIIKQYDVDYVVSEIPHGSQNAQAAVMIGIVMGIVVTMTQCLQLPVEMYSEDDSKKIVVGTRSCTKAEMIEAVGRKLKVPWTGVKFRDEAVADALAIYLVAMEQSQTLKYYKIQRKAQL